MTAFTWKSDDTSDLERSSKRGKQYLEDDLAGSNGVAKTSDGSSTDDVVCRALMAARYEDKVYALFDEIDIDQKGAIDGCDLQHFFVHSLKKRGIKMDIRVVALAVKTLLTNQNEPPRRPHINRCEFLSIFIEQEAFRKVICASDPECSQDKGQNCADVENGIRLGQATKNAEVHWKNSNRIWLWIIIYSTICLLVFITAAIHSAQHDEATEVFGNCFIVARASAKAINFHAMLVLLPITRQLTTFTRNSKLRWVLLPLEALHNVHAFLGIVLGIFTTIHVLAHASNYTRFIAADQEDILALFEDRVDELPPTDGKGRLLWALRQRATITGVVILVCMILAFSVIRSHRKSLIAFGISISYLFCR